MAPRWIRCCLAGKAKRATPTKAKAASTKEDQKAKNRPTSTSSKAKAKKPPAGPSEEGPWTKPGRPVKGAYRFSLEQRWVLWNLLGHQPLWITTLDRVSKAWQMEAVHPKMTGSAIGAEIRRMRELCRKK